MSDGEPVEDSVLKDMVEQAEVDPDEKYRQARKEAEAKSDEVTTEGVFWYINGQRVFPGMSLMAYDDRSMSYSLATVVDFNERALTVTFNDGFRFVFGKANPPLKLLDAPSDHIPSQPSTPEGQDDFEIGPWKQEDPDWHKETEHLSDLEYLDRANQRMFEMYVHACRLHENSMALLVDALKK